MRLAQTRERCVDLTGWKLEQSFSQFRLEERNRHRTSLSPLLTAVGTLRSAL